MLACVAGGWKRFGLVSIDYACIPLHLLGLGCITQVAFPQG